MLIHHPIPNPIPPHPTPPHPTPTATSHPSPPPPPPPTHLHPHNPPLPPPIPLTPTPTPHAKGYTCLSTQFTVHTMLISASRYTLPFYLEFRQHPTPRCTELCIAASTALPSPLHSLEGWSGTNIKEINCAAFKMTVIKTVFSCSSVTKWFSWNYFNCAILHITTTGRQLCCK